MHPLLPPLLALQRLPLPLLLSIGAVGGLVIFVWSYSNWRRTVKLVFVVALLEGAIRKWVFPQGQELVYFLKDALLAGAYAKFFLAPDAEQRRWRLHSPILIMTVAAAIVSLGALNPNIGSPILALYGIKIYLYYIPLAFMMPFLFRTEQEMVRQISWYLLLAIPIGVLGVLQFFAGPDSPLNVYANPLADEKGITSFGAASEHARITGTFSYLTGFTTYLVFFFGLTMALLSMQEVNVRMRAILIFGCIPLMVGNALMSGSRGVVFFCALIFLGFALATTFFNIGTTKNKIAVWLVVGAVAMIGTSYFFASSLAAWESRRDTSGDTTTSRWLHLFESISKASKDSEITGYGIGMAHPAVASMRRVLGIPQPAKYCPTYDAEMGQVYAELGPVGFASWYLIRVLAMYGTWQALAGASASPRRAIYLMCFLFQGLHLFGSVVFNHTAALFVWATYGFCLTPNVQFIGRRVARVPVVSRN